MARTKLLWFFILVNIFHILGQVGVSHGAFPLVFPLLTTGWYYKPSPKEQVFLGLILVKVLAIRLASVTGLLSFGKRSILSRKDHIWKRKGISKEDLRIIERILLSLKRTDTKDCFIREVCRINQNVIAGNATEKSSLLDVFKLRKTLKIEPKTPMSREWSVWESFEEVTSEKKMDCHKKFPSCPLSKDELDFELLLSETFF